MVLTYKISLFFISSTSESKSSFVMSLTGNHNIAAIPGTCFISIMVITMAIVMFYGRDYSHTYGRDYSYTYGHGYSYYHS